MYRIHSRNLLVLVPTYFTLQPRPCSASVWPNMPAYHTFAYLCVLRTPIQKPSPYYIHTYYIA